MDTYQATTHPGALPGMNYTLEAPPFGPQAQLVGQVVPPSVHHSPNLPMTTILDDAASSHSCAICGDRATGKHYGAYSCDGCKGFFRRSVRKSQSYTCRHHRQCTIDKDKRNQCRYCRLQKCFRVGMRKEAVQNERDKISTRRNSYEDPSARHDIGINALLEAENHGQNTYQQLLDKDCSKYSNGPRFAQVNHVCDSMRTQLLVIVEWAKSLTCFTKLSVDDQIALLRSHAGEFLILGVVYRSLDREDSLVLGNNFVINRSNNDPDISRVAVHIFDRLFFPLKEIRLDQIEYACLKAVLFFDPNAKDLGESQRRQVKQWRHQIQIDLMNYMNDKQYSSPGRFGDLLLMLPDLRMITQMMVQQVSLAKLTGFAQIDDLLQEMLLAAQCREISSEPSGYYHRPSPYMEQAGTQDTQTHETHYNDQADRNILFARPSAAAVMSTNTIPPPSAVFATQNSAMQMPTIAVNGQVGYPNELSLGTNETHSILDLDMGQQARYLNHPTLGSLQQSRSVPTSPTPNSFLFEPKTVPPIIDRRFFKSENDYGLK